MEEQQPTWFLNKQDTGQDSQDSWTTFTAAFYRTHLADQLEQVLAVWNQLLHATPAQGEQSQPLLGLSEQTGRNQDPAQGPELPQTLLLQEHWKAQEQQILAEQQQGILPQQSSSCCLMEPWDKPEGHSAQTLELAERPSPEQCGPATCELPAGQRRTALWPDPGHCRLSPEELSVRQVDRKLRVSGKTEKKQEDGKGSYSHRLQEFRQELDLPEGLNPEAVTCCLSPDGKLHVQAVKEEADRELSGLSESPMNCLEPAQTSPEPPPWQHSTESANLAVFFTLPLTT
uniref:SHSP domain-containing protein n=1 Tax=Oryzias melastigma TaxID=30732 RepID=A0A3B3B5G4_ORYME